MDALGWLRLQLDWGADEALAEAPLDRRSRPAPPPAPAPPVAAAVAEVNVVAGSGALARARAAAAAAATADELRAALAAFDGCALRATATSLVFVDGDPAARTLLVADVPGPAEDRAGVPFAGANAAFLGKMLATIGLDRAALAATCLLPWRPPGDRKPAEAEIQLCLPFFHRHLQLLAPDRMLVFGTLAARTLLGGDTRRGRSGWQAATVPGLPEPVPSLFFPSVPHIQSTPAARREAWANLQRLRRAMDEAAPPPAPGPITFR